MRPLRARLKTDVRLYEPGANPSWRVRYYDVDGRRRFLQLGKGLTRRQAEEMAERVHTELARRPELRQSAALLTLSEWSAEYLRLRADAAPATLRNIRLNHRRALKHWPGSTRLSAITPREAARFSAAMIRAHSPMTARQSIKSIAAWLRSAKRLGLITIDPFEGVKTPRVDEQQPPAYIDPAAFARLIAALPDERWWRLVGLARWAGLRRMEALSLRWSDVDLSAKRITIRNRRGHVTTKDALRAVPIRPELAALLTPTGKASEPVVDLVNLHWIQTVITKARKAANLPPGKPLHSLRASAEADWIMQGIDVYTVSRWIGHSPEVAKRWYFPHMDAAWQTATAPETRVVGVLAPRQHSQKPAKTTRRPGSSAG